MWQGNSPQGRWPIRKKMSNTIKITFWMLRMSFLLFWCFASKPKCILNFRWDHLFSWSLATRRLLRDSVWGKKKKRWKKRPILVCLSHLFLRSAIAWRVISPPSLTAVLTASCQQACQLLKRLLTRWDTADLSPQPLHPLHDRTVALCVCV